MNPLWLLRMARWLRHPPALWQVWVMLAVAALGLGIVGAEHLGLWPDWARVNGPARVFRP